MAEITVEFFGMARQRAGRSTLTVAAATLTEVLHAIERACPQLGSLRGPDGQLAKHFLLSLDGQRFLRDVTAAVPAGTHLLLLSADAGG